MPVGDRPIALATSFTYMPFSSINSNNLLTNGSAVSVVVFEPMGLPRLAKDHLVLEPLLNVIDLQKQGLKLLWVLC